MAHLAYQGNICHGVFKFIFIHVEDNFSTPNRFINAKWQRNMDYSYTGGLDTFQYCTLSA